LLDDSGVKLSASYTKSIVGNLVVGMTRSFIYSGNLSFGMQLDFDKLIKWDGLTLAVSAVDQNGSGLSARNIGNQSTIQQFYGTETAVFYGLVLEQRLLEDKVGIKVVPSPLQNISKLPFQVNSGIVYKGFVPARDHEIIMLGFVYGNFSDD